VRPPRSIRFLLLPLSMVCGLACGGALTTPKGGDDAGADAATDSQIVTNHRAAGAACPQSRGPGAPAPNVETCTSDQFLDCLQDTDCTAGTNGRCFTGGPIACLSVCSYDTCASDSDCPDNQPCVCRPSSTDSAANSCVTGGNCRVDTDCGPGGSCSPSQVNSFCFCPSTALCTPDDVCTACTSDGSCTSVPCACGDSCGHAFFCHTPQDDCGNDSDCAGSNTCNYDVLINRWTCAWCVPVP